MILRSRSRRWYQGRRRTKIGVSVGHCLLSPGAINPSLSLVEFNACVLIVREMADILWEFGYLPFVPDTHELAHNNDINQTISEISQSGVAVAVEMHLNSFEDSSVQGSEVIWSGEDGDEQSRVLAYYIDRKMEPGVLSFGGRRGIKTQADVGTKAFLRDICGIPHCIVEPCFMSNPTEASWIRCASAQDAVALAVCEGISWFLKSRR